MCELPQLYATDPHSAHNRLRAHLKRRLENNNLRQWSATVILRLRHAWGVLALIQKPADLVVGQSCWHLLPGSCNADLHYLLFSQPDHCKAMVCNPIPPDDEHTPTFLPLDLLVYPRSQQNFKSWVVRIVVGGLLGVGVTGAWVSFVVFTKIMAILAGCLEVVRNGRAC